MLGPFYCRAATASKAKTVGKQNSRMPAAVAEAAIAYLTVMSNRKSRLLRTLSFV
jgi:hypothetical protein